MWPSRRRTETVTCLACGSTIDRAMAREYDKHGDRWDRDGKQFEHLCKPCHGDLCHHARTDLETVLVQSGAGTNTTEEFLSRYLELVEDRYGPLEER